VLNRQVVEFAVRAAIALSLTVHERSVFARKNYFYPDLPKGYQISQFDQPISTDGYLTFEKEDGTTMTARIERIHIEEDAGKNLHGLGSESVVDLNRAGTPLIEIVGAPDLRSAAEAAAYLKALRDVLMFMGVNDGNLEEGSFRCDANVSVRPQGQEAFGTRCEVKNVNSFRFVQKAIEYEIDRQTEIVRSGGKIHQETRGWNERESKTFSLRSKEEAHDYRYFPDPDLPPLVLEPTWIEQCRGEVPDTPTVARQRLQAGGLTAYAAKVLTGHPAILRFFDEAHALYRGDFKKLGNFVQSEILGGVVTTGLQASFPVSPSQVAELLHLVDNGTISGKQAKEVYAGVVGNNMRPADYIRDHAMAVQSDVQELEAIAQQVIAANPKQAESYRSGKIGLLGFFVGAIMKETKGSANPAVVNTVLKRLLDQAPGNV